MIIIKLIALSECLVGTTENILEIISPYYLIQGIIKIRNIGYKIANVLENDYLINKIHIPEFSRFCKKNWVKIKCKNKKNLRPNIEYEYELLGQDIYFYIEQTNDEDNESLIKKLNKEIIRLGKGNNRFEIKIVDEGKPPNVFINHKDSNTYINVPFFTCSKMSFRRQKNLGNPFNQRAEGGLYRKIPCLYSDYEETIWNNLYFIKKININKDYSYFSPRELYAIIKSKICGIYHNSEFSGHNEDGTPVCYDHMVILPIQFRFGINHYATIVWILFPKKMKDGSDINEIVSIDDIMDIVEEEFGGKCNNSYLQSDFSLKPSYYYHNLTDIIINNPFKKGENKNRQSRKFEKLLRKSLSGNGINCDFSIELDLTGIKSAGFLPEDIKNKYGGNNKIIIRAGSLRLKFSRKIKGPILIGSGKYIGYGVLLPIKGKKI